MDQTMPDVQHTPFELGSLVAFPGALLELHKAGEDVYPYLVRHQWGDWGDVSQADAQQNREASRNGGRISSRYTLQTGATIWITTEADRSKTVVLLPEEYVP